MPNHTFRLRAFAFVGGILLLAVYGWASADPPSRVARLGYTTGTVSYSPAGESDWVQASINRPLTTGDRLWADPGSRAEIQVGGAMIRMGADTGVSILNLDDRITQLQLTQGTLNVRVRRLGSDQTFEVDTPNLAFTLRQAGEYRIEVDPDGNATTIVVRKGRGEVYGDNASYMIDSNRPYRFTGTDLREYRQVGARQIDEFDRWTSERDRRYDSSVSARYVSPDVVGYQDLDANGTWRVDATYGNIWYPSRVATGWAPYRDGHWAWVDPWGWTWIDDAPWGYAVSHYGRWTNQRGAWGWVPGPVSTRAYYAPALVVFLGGDNFQLSISGGNVGGVAWFPLGPREVYRPSYTVSRGYFENVNRSNTVINNTVINNYYTNTNVTNVVYANQQIPGAVVAVAATTFVQSQPVARATVRVSGEMMAGRPVAAAPSVAPTERSVRGAAAQGGKPPQRAFDQPVVARTAPPAARVGFAAQEPQLRAKPGKPLEDSARQQLKPAAAAPASTVRVVAVKPGVSPTYVLPPPAPTERQGGERGKSEERKAPAPERAVAPKPETQSTPEARSQQTPEVRSQQTYVTPPPAPTERKGGERGKSEERKAPAPERAVAPKPETQSTPEARSQQTPEVRSQQTPEVRSQQTPEVRSQQTYVAPPPAPIDRPGGARGKSEERKPAATPAPAKQAEPGPPVAARNPPPAPMAQPRGEAPKPSADKGKGKDKDNDKDKDKDKDERDQGNPRK